MKKYLHHAKWFLLILFYLVIHRFRILFFVLILLCFIYDIVKKNHKRMVQDGIIIFFAIISFHISVFRTIDFARFYVMNFLYEKVAKQIVYELQDVKNIYWGQYSTDGLLFITADDVCLYMKNGKQIAIVFPTESNRISGYVYFENLDSKVMFENPSIYWPQYTKNNNIYMYYKQMSNNWAYVQFY